MLEEIYNKTNIDMTAFIKRLEIELSIVGIQDEEKKKMANAQLICSIYDTMIIILGKTHQEKILNNLYTTWLRMTKDYWYLNKYDKLFVKNIDINSDENSNLKIKNIQIGDTTTTFADTSSQIEINGTTYNTGTVDFDEDILVEKYKKALYENRRMRW